MDLQFDNDLIVTKGDLVLVEGVYASVQRIRDRLQTFIGEWFLDLEYGVDYLFDILVKNENTTLISTILKREMLKSEPDTIFENFDVELDNVTRAMTITYSISVNGETAESEITV